MNIKKTMQKATAVATISMLATGALTQSSFAETLMEKAQDDGLQLAFYNSKPWSYEDENGDLVGVEVETLSVVLERIGGTIGDAQAVDWGALIPGLKTGRFDVVATGMYVTPSRCAEVQFSEPGFGIAQTLIVAAGNPHGIENYESMAEKDLTFAMLSGGAQTGYAKVVGIADENIMTVPDHPTAIAAIRAGRAHSYAVSVPTSRGIVSALPEQDMEIVPSFTEIGGKPASPHGAFAFRQDNAGFVEAFNAEMVQFIGSPEHLTILKKHGMDSTDLPQLTTAELCNG